MCFEEQPIYLKKKTKDDDQIKVLIKDSMEGISDLPEGVSCVDSTFLCHEKPLGPKNKGSENGTAISLPQHANKSSSCKGKLA